MKRRETGREREKEKIGREKEVKQQREGEKIEMGERERDKETGESEKRNGLLIIPQMLLIFLRHGS